MKHLRFWGPPILWMMTIFLLSNRPTVQVSETVALNFVFYKTLHVLEYSTLSVLLYRAIRNTFIKNKYPWVIAIILTVLYAMTDEFHQSFIPTREPRVRDVIIDGIGALIAWIFHTHLLPRAPRRLKTWAKNWQLM